VNGTPPTIVLVEDEPSVLSIMTRVLTRSGYEVTAFECPLKALAFLRSATPPSLLLTDVVMPGMSGFELCDAVRRRFPDLPVIFTSGYPLENLPGYARPLPAKSCLIVKPFGLDEVRETIDCLLQTSGEAFSTAARDL
jgi:two-component system, cell cycle sensor histidine kinase and response regulator CckA